MKTSKKAMTAFCRLKIALVRDVLCNRFVGVDKRTYDRINEKMAALEEAIRIG